MTMWIIMGVLVFLIMTFLVVMAIKDKINAKKKKIEFENFKFKQKESIKNVLIFIEEIYLYNENLLKNFKPSIGKMKMGDIKNQIKNIINNYQETKDYVLAEKRKENNKIINIIKNMKKESATTWKKKFVDDINIVKKEIKKLDKNFVKKERIKAKKILKDLKK